MEVQVVVSRYNEDVSWLNKIMHPVIVYDKSESPIKNSIPRKNIGREADTLLYYIITNYNNLPNYLIFLQGDPRGNPIQFSYEEVAEKVNNFIPEYKSLMGFNGNANLNNYFKPESKIIYNMYFGESSKRVWYAMGVEYIIPIKNIKCRSLEFYKKLHKQLLDPQDLIIDPWSIEPIFGTIFNPEIKSII